MSKIDKKAEIVKLKCNACGIIKESKDFYVRNKHQCKKCVIKHRVSLKYKKMMADPEYRKKRDEYNRIWFRNHPKKRTKNQLDMEKFSRKLNPEIKSASNFVYRNTKIGKINRPDACSVCKEKRRIVAHHENYDFPLEIDWACDPCHKRIHKEKRRRENEQRESQANPL